MRTITSHLFYGSIEFLFNVQEREALYFQKSFFSP